MGRRKREKLTVAEVKRLEMAWHAAFCPEHYDDTAECRPTRGDKEDVAILIEEFDAILADRKAAEISARVASVKRDNSSKAATG